MLLDKTALFDPPYLCMNNSISKLQINPCAHCFSLEETVEPKGNLSWEIFILKVCGASV